VKKRLCMLVACLCLPQLGQAQPASTSAAPVTTRSSTPPAGATTTATAPPLGRLFLTPEKRQALERQRQLSLQETESSDSDTVQLDGIVQRSSGRHSVWINQRMQSDSEPGLRPHIDRRNPGSAEFKPGNGSSTRLRVGETLNRSTQEQHDVVPEGAVNVRKR
jgi:hypothetical protein